MKLTEFKVPTFRLLLDSDRLGVGYFQHAQSERHENIGGSRQFAPFVSREMTRRANVMFAEGYP